MKHQCSHCGSTNLRTIAVIDVNTQEVIEMSDVEIWCDECGKQIEELKTTEEKKPSIESPFPERYCHWDI
tara:strand:+ start:66 stop:275 length:210 start_codon:yes stop_codon:yes gene_type:complete